MKRILELFVLTLLFVLSPGFGWAQAASSTSADADFPPFQRWRAAVLASDAATLRSLYRVDPPADVQINTTKSEAEADINYWRSEEHTSELQAPYVISYA